MPCNDRHIGPVVDGCRGDFDFTLHFQYVVLSAIPSLLFLFAAIARIHRLWKRPALLGNNGFHALKLIVILAYAAAQLAVLGTGVANSSWGFVLSATLAVICAPVILGLSHLEHGKNLRPSTILGVYLLLSTLSDVVRVRTYWLSEGPQGLHISFTLSTVIKFAVLILESVEKRWMFPESMRNKTPEAAGGVFNLLTFYWLCHLLWIGAKRQLQPNELYQMDPVLSTENAATAYVRAWQSTAKEHTTARGAQTLLRVLKWEFIATIPPRVVLLFLTVCSPLLLKELLAYLEGDLSQSHDALGYALILGFALLYLGIALSTGLYWYNHFRVITLVRASLVAAVNSKAASVDMSRLQDPQAILTLMSSDVERISEGLRTAHELWANVMQVGVATYLLQREVGVACIVPVLLAFVSAAVSLWVSQRANLRQMDWMDVLQTRIGASSSTLLSMKGIKMGGLEGTLQPILRRFRHLELVQANRFRFLGVWTVLFGYVPELISPALTFLVLIVRENTTGKPFNSVTAFTSLSIIQILAQPLNLSLQNLPFLVATFGCLSRIDNFLSLPDWIDPREKVYNHLDEGVRLSTLDKHPTKTGLEPVPLRKFAAPPLADADLAGALQSEKPIQSPKLLASDDNSDILALEHTSLQYSDGTKPLTDLSLQIPRNQLTCIIGPVASGKSTLCKALLGEIGPSSGNIKFAAKCSSISYCSQDPFIRNRSVKENIVMYSEFEPKWYNDVLQACDLTGSALSGNTIAGSDGTRLSGGQRQRVSLARALYARNKIMICDDVLSGLDASSASHVFSNVFGPQGLAKQLGMTVIFATHTVHFLQHADHVVVLGGGSVIQAGSFNELRSSSEYVKSLAVREKEELLRPDHSDDAKNYDARRDDCERDPVVQFQSDFSTYAFYFKTMKVWTLAALSILSLAIAGAYVVPSYWLKIWTNDDIAGVGKYSYWGIYTCILCSALFLLPVFEYVSLVQAATQAGVDLHDRIVQAVLNASWSLYSTMDVGSITNRFSQDLQLIDGELPLGLQNLVLSVLLAIGQAVLITVAAPYVGISFPIVAVVLAVVQRFYIRTSRQLRLLDLEAKSPLYTHFTEIVKGSSTIRAFGWTAKSIQELLGLLDLSQRPIYLLNMAQRWLTFVLDMIVCFITIIIVCIAVTLRSSGGSIGVALTQVMSTSLILRTIILTWTRVEQSLGAVSRIQEFSRNTPSEHGQSENQTLPPSWPKAGRIEFKDLTAIYTSRPQRPAVQGISGIISAGSKVGVCGGSGSGKSSLLLSLLHMLEYQSGTIEIDGIDLRTVSRRHLRNNINTIPQEPLMINGTIRLNLDPQCLYTDDQINDALAKTGMLPLISSAGGLAAQMKPDSYSSGQRQLFSLTAGLLRQTRKIVLIDEASSSTDHETDTLIQRLIREEFANCTVVTIAHRLETILDYDQVVVLDHGKVLEWDVPQVLLATESAFRRLWRKQAVQPDEPEEIE